MKGVGGRTVRLTAQHFLTYRNNLAGAADGTFWIKRIPVPILMVRDEADSVVQSFEPFMLLDAARSDGALSPSVIYELLLNGRSASAAAHGFVDNREALVEKLRTWIRSLGR